MTKSYFIWCAARTMQARRERCRAIITISFLLAAKPGCLNGYGCDQRAVALNCSTAIFDRSGQNDY